MGASLTGAGFGGNVLVVGEKSDELLAALRKSLFEGYYEPHEQAELEWFMSDRRLQTAFEDDSELAQIRLKLEEIVKRKQRNKAGMDDDDVRYTESVQRRINKLFKEGEIGQELLFIPANYYTEGAVANVPVECAGGL